MALEKQKIVRNVLSGDGSSFKIMGAESISATAMVDVTKQNVL